MPLADSYVLTAVKQAVGMPPLRRVAPDPMGKLAGVGGYPRMSARLIHVDFRGEGR